MNSSSLCFCSNWATYFSVFLLLSLLSPGSTAPEVVHAVNTADEKLQLKRGHESPHLADREFQALLKKRAAAKYDPLTTGKEVRKRQLTKIQNNQRNLSGRQRNRNILQNSRQGKFQSNQETKRQNNQGKNQNNQGKNQNNQAKNQNQQNVNRQNNNNQNNNNQNNNNQNNNNQNNNNQNNNNQNNNNGGNAQTSLTLDPKSVATGSASDGNPTGQQSAAKTSTNNFINFCISADALGSPIMNGKQKQQACNPIPMGMIAAPSNMPVGKFKNPPNLSTITANKDFNIEMQIKNLDTGSFTNPETTYFAAPAQINSQTKNIIGHSHFVIENIDSLESTRLTNPQQFAFFKGVDAPAQNGIMSVKVPGGLPAGTYRMGSIHSSSTHQPVLVAVAQHGMLDDVVYFTVK